MQAAINYHCHALEIPQATENSDLENWAKAGLSQAFHTTTFEFMHLFSLY